MDHTTFDALTRTVATRRAGLRTLLATLAGTGAAASVTSTRAKKKSNCPSNRRCGGECCRSGFNCVLDRCQRSQNACIAQGEACQLDSFNRDCCCWGTICLDGTCRKSPNGGPCTKLKCGGGGSEGGNAFCESNNCVTENCDPVCDYVCR